MTANTSPKFTLNTKNGFAKVTGVDGSQDGTDADVKLLYTANATDGGMIKTIFCQPISTSGSVNTSQAALRIYLNNGSTVGTASNNSLFLEYLLPSITVNVAANSPAGGYRIPVFLQIQAGYSIYVGVSAMAANTQWNFTMDGGDYS